MQPLVDTTERRIARLLADDPQQGLEFLLRAYGGRVRGYLSKRFRGLLSPCERDEAVNEALFRVWQRFDATRGRAGAWFLRMAHQAAVDLLRQRLARRMSPLENGEQIPAPGDNDARESGLSEERSQRLYAAIQRLSPREQAVIEKDLEADGKARTDDLARNFATQPSSISRSRRRAYRKLKEMLTE